jgi:hypothetical protein
MGEHGRGGMIMGLLAFSRQQASVVGLHYRKSIAAGLKSPGIQV